MWTLSQVESKFGLVLDAPIYESDYSTAYRAFVEGEKAPLFFQKFRADACGLDVTGFFDRWRHIDRWLAESKANNLIYGIDDGEPWFLTPYVPGLTLQELLERLSSTARTLPVSWMSSILTQICHQLMYWYEVQDDKSSLVHGGIAADHIRIGLDGRVSITGWRRRRGLTEDNVFKFNWDAAGFGAIAFDCHRSAIGESEEEMSFELDALTRLAIRFQRGLDKERFHLLSRELLSVFPHDWQSSVVGFSAWLSTEMPEESEFVGTYDYTRLFDESRLLTQPVSEETGPVSLQLDTSPEQDAATDSQTESGVSETISSESSDASSSLEESLAMDEDREDGLEQLSQEPVSEERLPEEFAAGRSDPFGETSTSVENFTTDETVEISVADGWEPVLEKMVNDGLIEGAEMKRVVDVYNQRGGRIIDVIGTETKIPEATITRVIVDATGTPRLGEDEVMDALIEHAQIMQFPQDFARSRLMLPLEKQGEQRILLVADPLDRVGIDMAFKVIQTAYGDPFEAMQIRVVEKSLLDRAIRKSYAPHIGERRKEARLERILAVYPDTTDASPYVKRFAQDGFRVEVESDPQKAIELIRFSPPSAVLCSHLLTDAGAFAFVRELRAGTNHIDLPIFVTDFEGDTKEEALYLDLAVEDVFNSDASLNILGKKIGRALQIRQRIRSGS